MGEVLQTPCMPFTQTNLTTPDFTQKADHSLSGTSASSQTIVLPYIWDEIILCNCTGPAVGTGGEAAELKSAVGSWGWQEQPCAGLPVNSTPRD